MAAACLFERVYVSVCAYCLCFVVRVRANCPRARAPMVFISVFFIPVVLFTLCYFVLICSYFCFLFCCICGVLLAVCVRVACLRACVCVCVRVVCDPCVRMRTDCPVRVRVHQFFYFFFLFLLFCFLQLYFVFYFVACCECLCARCAWVLPVGVRVHICVSVNYM